MRQLRILHTNMHRGGWGGQPNRILLLSKGLREKGHFVMIAAPKGATLIKRAREEGIPTFDELEFPKKFKPFSIVRDILNLHKVIVENDIEIVHTHGSQDTWAATLAARLSPTPKVVVRTRHNTFPVANHLGNRLLNRKLIDYIIAVSQGTRETYKSTGVLGHKIEKMRIIYSAVDPSRFKNCERLEEKVKAEFGIEDEFVFVKVGRLAKEKGHSYFIEVAKRLNQMLKSRFFALGEGPLRNKLEEQVKELQLEESFTFTGLRNDVCGFLRCADVFIFTPISGESLGTAVLESLYHKLPVVSFRIEGINASVEDRKNGFLVELKDTDKAHRKALAIATSKRERTKMGANGKRKIEGQFLITKLIEDTERLYLELMNSL